jgi:hypothetical protein
MMDSGIMRMIEEQRADIHQLRLEIEGLRQNTLELLKLNKKVLEILSRSQIAHMAVEYEDRRQ